MVDTYIGVNKLVDPDSGREVMTDDIVDGSAINTSTGAQTLAESLDRRIPYFDNVADMISSESLYVGAVVKTLGYYSPGDGGGNRYEIVAAATGAADGGSLIDLNGSGFQAKGAFPNGMSVLQFGAVADDLNDVTSEFQSAIDSASARGTHLFVPTQAGSYLVNSLDVKCSIVGYGAKLLRSESGETAWLTPTVDDVEIKGLTLDGAYYNQDMVVISNLSGVEVSNNKVIRGGTEFVRFNGCYSLKVSGNTISSGIGGITNDQGEDNPNAAFNEGITISGNTIDNIPGTGIYLSGKRSSTDPYLWVNNQLIGDATISGNFIRGCGGHGIIAQCRRTSISSNQVFDCGATGGVQSIVPQGDMISVTGNVIEGGAGVGIDMGLCSNSSVTGNTVREKGEIGIELQSCRNTTCTGNTVSNCASSLSSNNSAGIVIGQGFFGPSYSSVGVVVSGNTVANQGNSGLYGISVDPGVSEFCVTSNYLVNSGNSTALFVPDDASGLVHGNITSLGNDGQVVTQGSSASFVARNQSGTANLRLEPSTNGNLQYGLYFGSASNPSSFNAQSYLKILDRDGNAFYIPMKAGSPW